MDQKEHIATLCALGTVGVAAAGLAFATAQDQDHVDTYLLSPGKRKRPGSSTVGWPLPPAQPLPPRRSVSQPTTPFIGQHDTSSTPFHPPWNRLVSITKLRPESREHVSHDGPPSRGSSRSRMSILRPRTAASKSTIDHRESSSSSGWIKRLSSFSSNHGSSASSLFFKDSDTPKLPATDDQRPATSAAYLPNKLVKRSFSQRGLSTDEAQGHILRRPATSHQRSQTFKDILSRPPQHETPSELDTRSTTSTTAPLPRSEKRLWTPYFTVHTSRKRRKSETATAGGQIRVVSVPVSSSPAIILGSDLEVTDDLEGRSGAIRSFVNPTDAVIGGTRRPRRSLSSLRKMASRRRNFTDPSVHLSRTDAVGTISPVRNGVVAYTSPQVSADGDSPLTLASAFNSSPPLVQQNRKPYFQHRPSVSASDPPTTSSDTDGRVFSDLDSMQDCSDTNYDSIATRTTTASANPYGDSKLETIFAVRTSDETEHRLETWRSMSSLAQHEDGDIHMADSPFSAYPIEAHGIGIALHGNKSISTTSTHDDAFVATPPRTATPLNADDFDTPMPLKTSSVIIDSSPPLLPILTNTKEYDRVGDMLNDMTLDGDDLEWASRGDTFDDFDSSIVHARPITSSPGISIHSGATTFSNQLDQPNLNSLPVAKPSIFDWSEHQQLTIATRPKTVHGKQGKGDRSRPAGRKASTQLHFRSQSVPVNRDSIVEELPTASKFQTWRLGHKPVSEEWSDDFEFDDAPDLPIDSPIVDLKTNPLRDSMRSVKIPQAIIDRQPSVHLQFGQVQEFMAWVEELKRLRSRGAELHILYGHAKHLWEDAENIISLATINDEEETVTVSSPAPSDPFVDVNTENSHVNYKPRKRRPTTTGRRSVSTMITPNTHGRARGESLVQARHFLQAMHEVRNGSSPHDIEIHHKQKKLPFDTQDLKDLVVRSGAITRALKEEIRRAEGVSISPLKVTPNKTPEPHPLNELFRIPEPHELSSSPCPQFHKPGLPKSRSANSYLDSPQQGLPSGPFSSPITMTAVM